MAQVGSTVILQQKGSSLVRWNMYVLLSTVYMFSFIVASVFSYSPKPHIKVNWRHFIAIFVNRCVLYVCLPWSGTWIQDFLTLRLECHPIITPESIYWELSLWSECCQFDSQAQQVTMELHLGKGTKLVTAPRMLWLGLTIVPLCGLTAAL